MTPVEWFAMIPIIISTASALAAITPTKKDDRIVRRIRQALDILALNVKHAESAETKEARNDGVRGRRRTDV